MNKLERNFIDKFNSIRGDKWEYVSGYINNKSNILIKCKKCGEIRSVHADRSKRKDANILCKRCKRIEKERKKLLNKNKPKKKYSVDKDKLEKKFIRKFNKKYGKYFEYLGGYKEGKIICKCKVCGEIKERVNNKLFDKDRNIACMKCYNNYKGSEIKECIECNKKFIAFSDQQVMCKDCHDKQEREKQKMHKRLREAKAKENGKIEWSISLDKLIQRDEGICKICGRKVDINDYYYNNEGYFIAGNNYPSIDHIIPLAKGGTHTWDNVQLTHRYCNSIKCDKMIDKNN